MKKGIKTEINEKIRILKGVVETYAKGVYPIASILKTVPLSESSFSFWIQDENEQIKAIKETYQKAKKKITAGLLDEMVTRVPNNLQRLAEGYVVEDEETVFITDRKGNVSVKQKTVRKRHIPPNLGAIKFIATNAAPDQFKDITEQRITGRVETVPQVKTKLSDEEFDTLEKAYAILKPPTN